MKDYMRKYKQTVNNTKSNNMQLQMNGWLTGNLEDVTRTFNNFISVEGEQLILNSLLNPLIKVNLSFT